MKPDQSYRDGEILCVTDLEYKRVCNENKVLRLRSRQIALDVAWSSMGVTLVLLAAALVIFPVYWGLFRGSAWGLSARQNAEREALRYAQPYYPGVALRVTCEDLPGDPSVRRCRVFNTAGAPLRVVQCDDDEPFRNDGCTVDMNPTR